MKSNKSGIKYMDRSVFFDKNGYPKIKIANVSKSVHRLEWIKFNGEIPENMTVNHRDGSKINWHISNLELLTQGDNVRHAWVTGLCTPSRGESHGRSKLTNEIVLTIRTLPRKAANGRGTGFSNVELAKKYGVSAKVLSEARKGSTWRHLPQL